MDQAHVIRHKVLIEGRSRRSVAREMGVSRNTVRKSLHLAEPYPFLIETSIEHPPSWWCGGLDQRCWDCRLCWFCSSAALDLDFLLPHHVSAKRRIYRALKGHRTDSIRQKLEIALHECRKLASELHAWVVKSEGDEEILPRLDLFEKPCPECGSHEWGFQTEFPLPPADGYQVVCRKCPRCAHAETEMAALRAFVQIEEDEG